MLLAGGSALAVAGGVADTSADGIDGFEGSTGVPSERFGWGASLDFGRLIRKLSWARTELAGDSRNDRAKQQQIVFANFGSCMTRP
jgi:hypothetical protein